MPSTRPTGAHARSTERAVSAIDQLLEVFAIPTYSAETFEADDVLAALAKQAQAQGVEVLIVTGAPTPSSSSTLTSAC